MQYTSDLEATPFTAEQAINNLKITKTTGLTRISSDEILWFLGKTWMLHSLNLPESERLRIFGKVHT